MCVCVKWWPRAGRILIHSVKKEETERITNAFSFCCVLETLIGRPSSVCVCARREVSTRSIDRRSDWFPAVMNRKARRKSMIESFPFSPPSRNRWRRRRSTRRPHLRTLPRRPYPKSTFKMASLGDAILSCFFHDEKRNKKMLYDDGCNAIGSRRSTNQTSVAGVSIAFRSHLHTCK